MDFLKTWYNIMPLETTPLLYFLISYYQPYQGGQHANFWAGRDPTAITPLLP
jgi:hypothetical protein